MSEVLSKLKKYKIIFNLPSNIKENTSKNDFKKVVHDYSKAKFFFKTQKQQTDSIFKPLTENFELQIGNLRRDLMDRLKIPADFQIIFERKLLAIDEMELIEFLIELDCETDPAWFYLTEMHKCAKDLLELCVTEFSTKRIQIEQQRSRQMDMDAKYQEIVAKESKTDPEVNEEKKLNSNQVEINESFDKLIHLEVLATIQRTCEILEFILPDFYQLAQHILSGKFYRKKSKLHVFQLHNRAQTETKIIDLLNTLYYEFQTKADYHFTLLTKDRSTLCSCVNRVLKCHDKLSSKASSQSFLSSFESYAKELREHIIRDTWIKCKEEVDFIWIKEQWQLVSNDRSRVTYIPYLFREIISRTISLTSQFLRPDDTMRPVISDLFISCMTAFCDNLHKLGFDPNTDDRMLLMVLGNISYTRQVVKKELMDAFAESFARAKPLSIATQEESEKVDESERADESAATTETYDDDDDDDEDEDESDVGSYSIDTLTISSPNAVEMQKKIKEMVSQFSSDERWEHLDQMYELLASLVLNRYVSVTARTLVKFVEKGVLLSGYNWKDAPRPMTVRPFVLKVLLSLSLSHSRICGIDSAYADRVFGGLTERIAEILSEYLVGHEKISENGAFQMDIEIAFISRALKKFENERSKTLFMHLCDRLSELSGYRPDSSSKKSIKENILNDMQEKTRLQLNCFQDDE
ncbi:hypothetical protein AKO1_014919 [Acrasis kona]|uniref:Exocyst complex component n=1 Tax=Acrasis kona TaxID=1008807 RepID=A0AAW2Z2Q7_9EUKA